MSKSQLIKNSAIGIIQLIFTGLLTLLSVPVFIHKLGIELYGIFAVVSIIGNLNMLTNFGLNGALLVSLANQGKCKESDYDIIVTQLIMSVLIGVFTFTILIFKSYIVDHVFSIPVLYKDEAGQLLMYLVLANALLLIGQTFTSILDSMQKIFLTNICQFIYSSIYWGGLILIVTNHGGLREIGLVAFFAAIIWFILVFVISLKTWGNITILGVKKEFNRIAKKQIYYGLKIYLSGIAGFLFEPLSKLLLSHFVSLQAVALFELGAKVKVQINGIITRALYPIYPYIANSPNDAHLHIKLIDFSKKIQIIVVPISITLVFILPTVLNVWLGDDNSLLINTFVITMVTSFILLSPPVYIIYQFMAAKNLADRNIWVQVLSAIVNIAAFFVSLKIAGVYAILISNSLAFVSSFLLCNFYQCRFLKTEFDWHLYFKLLIFTLVCVIICLFCHAFIHIGAWQLIFYPILISVLFIFFLKNTTIINSNDLELYLGTFPVLKRGLAKLIGI